VVFVGGSGQLDGVVKLLSIPLFRNADIVGIKTEFPGSGQWDHLIRYSGIYTADKEYCKQNQLDEFLLHNETSLFF
jgi:hypothetical protein